MATGWENLVLQGRLYGGELHAVRRRAEELAGVLDLADFASRKVDLPTPAASAGGSTSPSG